MGYCPNCKTRITCGCQNAKAKNGQQACTKCVNALNQSLTAAAANNPKNIAESPSNVKASYVGPGLDLGSL